MLLLLTLLSTGCQSCGAAGAAEVEEVLGRIPARAQRGGARPEVHGNSRDKEAGASTGAHHDRAKER